LLNNFLLKKKTHYGQALFFVSLIKQKAICLYYNKDFIYFNTCYDHLFYYQNTLPTPTSNAETASLQHSRGAPTTRPRRSRRPPQRCQSVLSNTMCKRQAAAFVLSMHDVLGDCTAFPHRFHGVAGVCTARTSAICNCFKRCGNAVRTPR